MARLNLSLIEKELKWQFSKSSGPGGQHVNTTDSKAKLIWNIEHSTLLSQKQKNLIRRNLKNYLNKAKDIIQFSCSTNRSKERNKQECIKKLKHLLNERAFFEKKKRGPVKK
jgi:ribosome-associated protein